MFHEANLLKKQFVRELQNDFYSTFAEKYLHKGALVSVEGKLSTRSYEKDGSLISITEIICFRLNKLSSTPKQQALPIDNKAVDNVDFGEPPQFDDAEELPF